MVYDAPSSLSTNFTARSDAAVNVGVYQDDGNGGYHGFVLRGTRFTAVNYPEAINTFLNGINKAGLMAGGFVMTSGNGGFALTNGKFTPLQFPGSLNTVANGVSNANVIVGEYDFDGANLHGFILQNGVYQTVDDPDKNNAFGTTLFAINSSGVVVGEFEDAGSVFHGFIYKNGIFKNVIFPGSTNTFVKGINDNGIITGLAFFADGTNKPFAASCQ
jgi:probable HAF family extracellular repeat protein